MLSASRDIAPRRQSAPASTAARRRPVVAAAAAAVLSGGPCRRQPVAEAMFFRFCLSLQGLKSKGGGSSGPKNTILLNERVTLAVNNA